MAKVHGKVGAIYWTPTMTATTIAFVDGGAGADTITDSGSAFVTTGYKAGDLITVSGSTSNDGNYTIVSLVAGTITLATGVLTAEAAGDSVTIRVALPGQLVAGFYGWNFTDGVDIVDVTDFVDGAAGYRKYITGLRDWTAEAAGWWLTDDWHGDWTGDEIMARFFAVYDTAPNVTTAYFYSGKAIVSGIETASAVDAAITENITFQGSAKATLLGTGIAFVDGGGGADTITDTGNGFIAAGFEAGDEITVVGSTSSDGTYTIVSVVAGTITLATGSLPGNEAAGDSVTISATVKLVVRSTAWPT
jgi:hypothetical protein